MDLSIIIPVYNTDLEKFKNCIKSVMEISAEIDYEIIVVNDGAKKEFSIEYEKYIKNISCVVYLKQENSGVSSARNAGIKISKGKYIMFVDSDDKIYGKRIKKKYIDLYADIVIFNKEIISNKKKIKLMEFDEKEGYIENKKVIQEFISKNKFHNPFAQFINRKFINDNEIRFNTNFIQGEDALFNLTMILKKSKIYYSEEVIYKYNLDYSTYDNRWLNYPKEVFNNFKYLYYEKYKALDFIENRKKAERELNCQYVNALFSYSLNLCCNEYKKYEDVLDDMSKFMKKIKIKKESNYLNLKKNLIKNKHWNVMCLISKCRKLYRNCKNL